jgi:hypothetical protein
MANIIKQARSTGPGSVSIIRGAEPKNLDKIDGIALQRNVDAIKCSLESDGTTTYVQKKEWDDVVENYKFPPFVECEYVN